MSKISTYFFHVVGYIVPCHMLSKAQIHLKVILSFIWYVLVRIMYQSIPKPPILPGNPGAIPGI